MANLQISQDEITARAEILCRLATEGNWLKDLQDNSVAVCVANIDTARKVVYGGSMNTQTNDWMLFETSLRSGDWRNFILHILDAAAVGPEGNQPHFTTPPNQSISSFQSVSKQSPDKLPRNQIYTTVLRALEPFAGYLTDLAEGKLDIYFDAMSDKPDHHYPGMFEEPFLLLHKLGEHYLVEENTLHAIFSGGIVHLYNVSGSGKTRGALEAICKYGGVYISCATDTRFPSGSNDYEEAKNMMQDFSTWRNTSNQTNSDMALRAFFILLYARIYVFVQFLHILPKKTTSQDAKRRLALLQFMPPLRTFGLKSQDIFCDIIASLRGVTTADLQVELPSLENQRVGLVKQLFPGDTDLHQLCVVVDEAQKAVQDMSEYFHLRDDPSTPRPILRELVNAIMAAHIFEGIVLVGTGLSPVAVGDALHSASAKASEKSLWSKDIFAINSAVYDDVKYNNQDNQKKNQKKYIQSLGINYDERLMERMLHWLCGRHRLTASFLEILLLFRSQNLPHHRILTAFVEHVSGFRITDAHDIEEKEPEMSHMMHKRIKLYGCLIDEGRVSKLTQDKDLFESLTHIVMRWTTNSAPTHVQKHTKELILGGLGHLQSVPRQGQSEHEAKLLPVYIDEPLIILNLLHLFKVDMTRSWLRSAIHSFQNPSQMGHFFEEITMLIIVQHFGGQKTLLEDVFDLSPDCRLRGRRFELVSLRRGAGETLIASPTSWRCGSSERLGFRASTPENTLSWLNNPEGTPFLFPDRFMGPDAVSFLRDVITGEYLGLFFQNKLRETVTKTLCNDALQILNPENFYMETRNGHKQAYSKKSRPTLKSDMLDSLKRILGSESTILPKVNTPGRTLRSTETQSQPATAGTPKFLHVIATPNLPDGFLENQDSTVAALKWPAVTKYLGEDLGAALINTASSAGGIIYAPT